MVLHRDIPYRYTAISGSRTNWSMMQGTFDQKSAAKFAEQHTASLLKSLRERLEKLRGSYASMQRLGGTNKYTPESFELLARQIAQQVYSFTGLGEETLKMVQRILPTLPQDLQNAVSQRLSTGKHIIWPLKESRLTFQRAIKAYLGQMTDPGYKPLLDSYRNEQCSGMTSEHHMQEEQLNSLKDSIAQGKELRRRRS